MKQKVAQRIQLSKNKYNEFKKNVKILKIPGDNSCAIHVIFLALYIEDKLDIDIDIDIDNIKKWIRTLRCDLIYFRDDINTICNLTKKTDEELNWYDDLDITKIADMYGINIIPDVEFAFKSILGKLDRPTYMFQHVNENHFELIMPVEKFNNLDRRKKKFVNNYYKKAVKLSNNEVMKYCLEMKKKERPVDENKLKKIRQLLYGEKQVVDLSGEDNGEKQVVDLSEEDDEKLSTETEKIYDDVLLYFMKKNKQDKNNFAIYKTKISTSKSETSVKFHEKIQWISKCLQDGKKEATDENIKNCDDIYNCKKK